MSDEGIDTSKRQFLTCAAGVAGAVSAGFVATPFISSMQPSAKAEAAGAPVEVDISNLQPGQLVRVMWRGKPVWVLKRTSESLENLEKVNEHLRDPHSQESDQPDNMLNEYRSIKPEVFVALGVCTHLGCAPTYRPEVAPADLGPEWLGGFFCPCHASRFDLAGRVFKGVPAPKNLEIPPYRYLSENKILVGENQEEKS